MWCLLLVTLGQLWSLAPMVTTAWHALVRVAQRNPLAFGCVTSGVKTSAADLLVQTQVENVAWADIDWRRNLVFAAFGFGYLGGVQYLVYVPLFTRKLFPNAAAFAAKRYACSWAVCGTARIGTTGCHCWGWRACSRCFHGLTPDRHMSQLSRQACGSARADQRGEASCA